MKDPYLSIIRYARNDDHGGNFLARMQASLDCLFYQLEKYRIESELILVEWNPPPDKPPLREAIRWPQTHPYCTVRIIEVEPHLHQRYPHHDKISVHRAVPWNVGIRRARGKFIFVGSLDLLYPDELMAFLSSRSLKEDCLYRTTRWDVDWGVTRLNTVEDQLRYCKENVLRVHSKTFLKRKFFKKNELPQLHNHASGDFLLMSKNSWHRLRGYREADISASHADSLLCFTAYAAGIREVFLEDPIRIYHIYHANNFSDTINIRRPLIERLLLAPFWWLPRTVSRKAESFCHFLFRYHHLAMMNGVPTSTYFGIIALSKDVVSGKRSYIFNDEDWGLGETYLPEVIVTHTEGDRHQ